MGAQGYITQGGLRKGVITSGVKRQTVELTPADMDRRIINLRFIHKLAEPGMAPKTFTIRSDYEVKNTKYGYQYVPVEFTPTIKVEYKQVANDTVIELNVDVTGLFIKDPSSLESAGLPIEMVEIQMGYLCQMPDWSFDPVYSSKPIEDFYALKDDTKNPQYTTIRGQVLSVQRISGPPNVVTRFQCVIGSMRSGLRWEPKESEAVLERAKVRSAKWDGKEPKNLLPSTFYSLVTRRFINSTVPHDVNVKKPAASRTASAPGKPVEAAPAEYAITILDDNMKPVKILQLVQGRLSNKDAEDYGTHVFMSDKLWDLPMEELAVLGFSEDERSKAAPVERSPYFGQMEQIGAQLEAIKSVYPFLRWYVMKDGNYYVYHESENDEDFFSSSKVNKNQQEGILMLPAVYDITWGGTRTIRSPFFSLLGSMQTVAYQAKYALNDLVGSFYAPGKENNCFLVLLLDVTFSTAGGDNTMVMTCVDITGAYKPVLGADGSMSPVALPKPKESPSRNGTWVQKQLTVATVGDGVSTVGSTWASVVQFMVDAAKVYEWRWNGALPTTDQILDKIQAWNPTLFAGARVTTYKSSESGNYGRDLPQLFTSEYNPVAAGADVLDVKYPFFSLTDADYTPEEQIKT